MPLFAAATTGHEPRQIRARHFNFHQLAVRAWNGPFARCAIRGEGSWCPAPSYGRVGSLRLRASCTLRCGKRRPMHGDQSPSTASFGR